MSYTLITARITDQTVQLINLPLLASGTVGVLQVSCQFDSLWEGYGKTAVFYRNEEEVYHIPMVEGVAPIPHEVLADEGYFYFGVVGIADNTRTTEAVKMYIKRGAITVPTATPEEPTPDIYQQLLASHGKLEQAINVERARINQLTAMKGGGETSYGISSEYISGYVTHTGANAHILLFVKGLSLDSGGRYCSDYFPYPDILPLCSVKLKSSDPDLSVTLLREEGDDLPRLLIENGSSEIYTADMVTSAECTYPLAAVFVPEIADLRVDEDGNKYETAGEAIRAQFDDINSKIDGLSENNGSSGSGGAADLDTTLTQEGKAADAKAVGDKLGNIEAALAEIIVDESTSGSATWSSEKIKAYIEEEFLGGAW